MKDRGEIENECKAQSPDPGPRVRRTSRNGNVELWLYAQFRFLRGQGASASLPRSATTVS